MFILSSLNQQLCRFNAAREPYERGGDRGTNERDYIVGTLWRLLRLVFAKRAKFFSKL